MSNKLYGTNSNVKYQSPGIAQLFRPIISMEMSNVGISHNY